MKIKSRMRLRAAAVVLCRLAVGAVFILSGWSKAVDPAGFIIKIGEYLSAWHMQVPHEAIVAGAIALSAAEFCTGILVAAGCLKRVAVWGAAAMMAFMLPLTLYIAIADPVADCGCFGDFLKISNWATFGKNVVITAAVAYLTVHNRCIRGFYPAPVQWLVATAALAFPLTLSMIGYFVQPVADFRPFTLGSGIFHAGNENETDAGFVYERDGERRTFALDELPDDSWTFVEAETSDDAWADIAVRDEDGEDVSADIVDPEAPQAWLIVPDPGLQFLSRSHTVNELHSYLEERGIDFTALVGSRGAGYDYWVDLTRPTFPVYSAEDTSLEQLARGSAAVVYTRGGRIVWKRTLGSLPDDLTERTDYPEGGNALDTVEPVDDGRLSWFLTIIFAATLVALYLLGQSPKLLRLVTARKTPAA
ncbi:MAG: DoxX family protein [Muribaculaceae bacterium]|nr:DoxX family protein [Muribaculaceae bacterium]